MGRAAEDILAAMGQLAPIAAGDPLRCRVVPAPLYVVVASTGVVSSSTDGNESEPGLEAHSVHPWCPRRVHESSSGGSPGIAVS